jgi:glycosyltransferase involved in cell wall biosynthesis
MKLILDERILTHKTYTGVENYAKNIFENIKDKLDTNTTRPKTTNKYLGHLWTHLVLPFKSGDILFCPANIAPIFVPKSKKLIVTIHDVAFLTYPESFSGFFKLYYRFLMPIIIKRADKIITVSNYSKNEIQRYYSKAKDKIEVIYLGVNKDFKKLDYIKKKNQIVFVGSMNKRKNIVGVLKSFELLDLKDYKLLLIGNFSSNFDIDEETKQLIEKAKQNPNIEFKKNVNNNDLIKIYNQSKLFLFPSFYEGFGLPVLEAMSCATPVVCSSSSSLPEVGGDAVVYCNPNSIEDIKEKINQVITNEELQKEMIEKGLKRAKMFSWEKSAKEHIEIFKKVLKY